MIRKHAIIMMMTVALVTFANAQSSFYTKLHAKIAEAARLAIPDTLNANINNDSTWAYNGRTIRIRTNAYGEVSHIGYKLFDNGIIDAYKSYDILNFIERYALELDLKIDERSAAERMSVDKVVCGCGNINMLRNVRTNTPFSLEEKQRRMFRAKWDFNGKELCITIPADCQLIKGANAIELEELFEKGIKRIVPISGDELIDDWSMFNVSKAGDFLVANSDRYLSEMIRSDIYLIEKNGKRKLVADEKNPLQSLRNIMLTGHFWKDIPMCMTLNQYGYKSKDINVTLQQFIAYCQQEGCKLYFGVKTRDSNSIKGTLFALNTANAYNHVLSVDFPLSLLKDGTGTIKSVAYVYIPLHNITEKFFTEGLTK